LRTELRDDDNVLLELLHAPQSELWRINNGWRRASVRNGFLIDSASGRWGQLHEDNADDETAEQALRVPLSGIRPYVTDGRSLLLVRPISETAATETFARSLGYALQRALQLTYQVEEQELAVELIGRGAQQRLLLWEAAEGGIGIWDRLVADPRAFAELGSAALRICHFDPATGEPDPTFASRCAVACYECLLSYRNQREHRFLDRHAIREFLVALSRASVAVREGERGYEEQYKWLRERIDPASTFERQVIDLLFTSRLRLPTYAQHRPDPDVPAQVDFFYVRDHLPGVCVFIDGPAHEAARQAQRDREARRLLEDRGYRVIAIDAKTDLASQVSKLSEVFSPQERR